MKKNYILLTFIVLFSLGINAQVISEQVIDGNSGIISDYVTGVSLGTYCAEDFVLTAEHKIETITVPGFINGFDIENVMTGFNLYIYSDTAGLPSSNPNTPSTGLLEIINLSPTDTALSITNDAFTLDVTAANGGDFILPAGTYWLVVFPDIPTLTDRWSWYASGAANPQNAVIFDDGNFGAGFDWTLLTAGGLSFGSLAYTIEGTTTASVDDNNLNSISVQNPVEDFLTINMNDSSELKSVELFSINGQRVYNGTEENRFNVSNLNSGMYVLKATTVNGSISKRIIKK